MNLPAWVTVLSPIELTDHPASSSEWNLKIRDYMVTCQVVEADSKENRAQ